ncbi:transporter [Niabella aquatica]
MMKRTLTLITCLFLLTVTACAQSEKSSNIPMNADLPDETEEIALIDKGMFQVETAVLVNHYQDDASSVLGQLLVRYGLSDKVELRAILEDGKNRDAYFKNTVQATLPLGVGTKISLLKDHTWLPDMTFIGYLSLPFTSRSSLEQQHWSPILLMAFENKFSEKWKLEYNGGGQQEVFSDNWVWLANGSLHYKISNPLELFLEYFAQYPTGQQGHNNIGGGLTYELGHNTQIYLSGGSSVGYQEPNQFAAAGIAFRIH